MTLQSLRYVLKIAEQRSLSKAAKELYLSQSTLSAAVKELEEELGIRIFTRHNRGVALTGDGEDFAKHAREIVEQAAYLEQRYRHRKYMPVRFAVSTQRLPFAVRAFNRFISRVEWDLYDVAIRECPTNTLINDVAAGKSDLGVMAIHAQYLRPLQKIFDLNDLEFTEITRLKPYVFLRRGHPLAGREKLSMSDLLQYPFVTYDQDTDRSEYTEEIIYRELAEKNIHVCDRCTKIALVRFTDSFSIGPDLTNSNADAFHAGLGDVVSIPLEDAQEYLRIGYISKRGRPIQKPAMEYLRDLEEDIRIIAGQSPPEKCP